jgi:hypothetical protein
MSTATTTPRAGSKTEQPSLGLPVAGAVIALVVIVVGAILMGRRDEKLPSIYGRRRGAEAGRSVNGTAVFAEMFRKSGHTVITRSRFSPKLENYDVVVWIPDDFEPPTKERREHLEKWLSNGNQRTVIYVGRDYNAAIDYWERIVPQTPPDLENEALHRQAEARANWEAERSKMPVAEYARWFTVHRDEQPRRVDSLEGPWAEGIDVKQANIRLEGLLTVPEEADRGKVKTDVPEIPSSIEPLLSSGPDAIITRVTDVSKDPDVPSKMGNGQVIVVTNGSLVLNYPLVNHEHRKLAQKLIDECGQGGKVVFIENGPDGPPILAKEPTSNVSSPLELLKVWPLNAILLHLTVLGIILCLARAPIFGRPRELAVESPADFGKHVAALGKLLARTKDRNYAQARIAQYRQIAERKSGRSHSKTK